MTDNGDEVRMKVRIESLANEMDISEYFVAVLPLVYEELSGVKFQDGENPTDEEFFAFRNYLIHNYKKTWNALNALILNLEKKGMAIKFSDGSAAGFQSISAEVYKNIEEWAVSNGAQKAGGCYVATAVYGSYDCPQVWTMRRYRDKGLSATLFGRIFIRAYYVTSPMIAKGLGRSQRFNRIAKVMLDKIVSELKKKGYQDCPYRD